MTRRQRRLLGSACLTLLALAVVSPGARAADPEPYIAVVTADEVLVRSGAAESYYPFGRVETGQLVKVIGEKFNWARVAAVGPAFDELFGYIKYPKSETGRFRLADDGASGRTLGRTDILAPNLNTNYNPKDSWKPIARVEPDQELIVLETLETDRAIAHKVALPPNAVAWINLSFLAPATPSQITMWDSTVDPTLEIELVAETTPPAPPIARTPPAGEGTPVGNVLATDTPEIPPVRDVATDGTPAGGGLTEAAVAARTPRGGGLEDDTARIASASLDPELETLEAAFEQLMIEPLESAEVRPLQQFYRELANRRGVDKKTKAIANTRARQLELWAELQEREQALFVLRERVRASAGETDSAILALEMSSDYAVIGRVAASTIYDGQDLPRLYRVQEPGTGRTIAYLKSSAEFDLVSLMGRIVGIAGDTQYDPGLRLSIVKPKRIDLLAPQS